MLAPGELRRFGLVRVREPSPKGMQRSVVRACQDTSDLVRWYNSNEFNGNSLVILILPLSHKSGALCLYEPLPVSDALGDEFFEIFDVFLVETFFFFFSKLITLHGPTAAKKQSPQKGHILLPFRGK